MIGKYEFLLIDFHWINNAHKRVAKIESRTLDYTQP